ncbi:MAG: hypothetical protein GY694_22570 [Gammaproteobacteria bacterium]|nr:hypothetical protein [Gammaproteobacteria bacterium]
MTPKHLEESSWTVDEANEQIKMEYDGHYWQFLVRLINIKEVKWNANNESIDFAEYIPLKTLLNEVLDRIASDEFNVEECQVCQHYFNINDDEGIFGDTENLAHFICKKCAQSITAWEFYQNHLST